MIDKYTRITVPLSREEFEALRDSAQLDYRHPRDQARHLLRSLLLKTNSQSANKNSDVPAFHGQHAR
ncbi:hypothetical protein BH10CHL1_BH10CHL1_24360 [soil metagenome]